MEHTAIGQQCYPEENIYFLSCVRTRGSSGGCYQGQGGTSISTVCLCWSRGYVPEEWENWEIYRPDGVITFGVLNAGSITAFCDVGVNVFH